MFEKTKTFCDAFLKMDVPGFDLAVFKGGECILRHFNGYSDIENRVRINGKERYNIYSCSKPITCTAALQLWEKGMFSLEDKLSDYMPEFENMTVQTENGIKKAEKPILIKHLFEMTAGFSYNMESESLIKCKSETNGVCKTREAMKYLAKEPLLFEPGDRWEYSACHDVLAALVEVISGEKFEIYIKKNIFDIADMKDSTFMLPDDDLDTVAEQYSLKSGTLQNIGKAVHPFYKLGSEYASGGAGCISTVDDYIKFSEALRTGRLIKKETLKLMTTDRLTEHQKRTYWTRATHGYGLGVRCDGGVGNNIDFGWGGAAGAYLAVDLENEISIYYSSHLHFSPSQGARTLLYRLIMAELRDDKDEFLKIQNEIKQLYDYNLTY